MARGAPGGLAGPRPGAVGHYSLPGVETAVITTADLDAGARLTMKPPDGR